MLPKRPQLGLGELEITPTSEKVAAKTKKQGCQQDIYFG